MSSCQPECVCRNESATEVKRFIQCAGHFFTGFIIRAHVVYAGQQLRQTLAKEDPGPRAHRRWAAHAIWAHAWIICQEVHLWKKKVLPVSALLYPQGQKGCLRLLKLKQAKSSGRNAFGLTQSSLVWLIADDEWEMPAQATRNNMEWLLVSQISPLVIQAATCKGPGVLSVAKPHVTTQQWSNDRQSSGVGSGMWARTTQIWTIIAGRRRECVCVWLCVCSSREEEEDWRLILHPCAW